MVPVPTTQPFAGVRVVLAGELGEPLRSPCGKFEALARKKSANEFSLHVRAVQSKQEFPVMEASGQVEMIWATPPEGSLLILNHQKPDGQGACIVYSPVRHKQWNIGEKALGELRRVAGEPLKNSRVGAKGAIADPNCILLQVDAWQNATSVGGDFLVKIGDGSIVAKGPQSKLKG